MTISATRAAAFLAIALLSACGGNPFPAPGTGTGTGGTGGGGTPGGGTGEGEGVKAISGGEADGVTFDAATDTLTINNLPFDGQTYTNTGLAMLPGFGIYETLPVGTAGSRKFFALYRESPSAQLQVMAVATGDFVEVGQGGFEVRRTAGTVNLPATGEALYTGPYGGIRIINPSGGGQSDVQFTSGTAELAVDFGDFDVVGAVEGAVRSRRYFDVNGNLLGTLPTIILGISTMTPDGLFNGGPAETFGLDDQGVIETIDSGTYQGLFANADEIGGVIIIDGPLDPDGTTNLNVNERGVFTVAR